MIAGDGTTSGERATMATEQFVGSVLIAELVVFLIGAGGWRLEYEQPLPDALRVIHQDRRRRAWIHRWMIAAMLITPAGLAGLVTLVVEPSARALLAAAVVVYTVGAVCWIVSLVFRLTVVPWAAARTVGDGDPPEVFVALDRWAGELYRVHMLAAYATFAVLGVAVLADGQLPVWIGVSGIAGGILFSAGFLSRWAALFSPPLWAHLYTGVLGVALLIA
jgi:hypothetical protein